APTQLSAATHRAALTARKAAHELDHAGTTGAALPIDPFDTGVVLDPVDERIPANLDHGDLRDHQRLALGAEQPHIQQHARTQRMVGVVEIGAHGDRAAARIDPRVDGADPAFEAAARPG